MTLFTALRHLLACPMCDGSLDDRHGVIACQSCSRVFPQTSANFIDLLVSNDQDGTRWIERQNEMYVWYGEILQDDTALTHFQRDYEPFRTVLASMDGVVL